MHFKALMLFGLLMFVVMLAVVLQSRAAEAPVAVGGEGSLSARSEAEEIVRNAIQVISPEAQPNDADDLIPTEVIRSAAAIAIFPGMVKGALIAGGSYGSGVLLARQGSDQWRPPLFMALSGGSLGAQAGIETSDLILVFRNRDVLEKIIENDDFRLGADASISAGKTGASTSAGFNGSDIVAYKRARGFFAGLSIEGSMLSVEEAQTLAYYGLRQGNREDLDARGYFGDPDVLFGNLIGAKGKESLIGRVPDSAARLQRALQAYGEN